MQCPRCGCDRFRFRHPLTRQRLVGPITEKAECVINLITDPEFKDPDDPNLFVIFTCSDCDWSFLKPEGVPLQSAFARAQQR